MKSFWTFFDWIQDKMKIMGAVCLMGMTLMTCADVFLRGAFNFPIFGSEEIVSICAALAIGFSLPYAHKKDVHIGVEILVRLFSKKVQARIKLVTNLFSFFLVLLIGMRMYVYAGTMAKSGEVSMNLELPVYYVIYIMSYCFMIFSLFILKDIIAFFKGVEKDI